MRDLMIWTLVNLMLRGDFDPKGWACHGWSVLSLKLFFVDGMREVISKTSNKMQDANE